MSRRTREARAAAREEKPSRPKPVVAIVGTVVAVAIVGVAAALALGGGDAVSGEADPTPGASGEPTVEVTETPSAAKAQEDPTADLPLGVFPAGHPLEYGFALRDPSTIEAGQPIIEVWEDFQCPSCKMFEEGPGELLRLISSNGQAHVVFRPTAFLDARGGDSSARAIAALGCAIDQGKGLEFHGKVFENQPENEGTGLDNQQFIQFGTEVGIAGDALNEFGACIDGGRYLGWAENTTAAFHNNGIEATPTVVVNGQTLGTDKFADPQTFVEGIAEIPLDPSVTLN